MSQIQATMKDGIRRQIKFKDQHLQKHYSKY